MPVNNSKKRKLREAFKAYERGETTLWKIAHENSISLREIIAKAQKRDVIIPYSINDLKEDIKGL